LEKELKGLMGYEKWQSAARTPKAMQKDFLKMLILDLF